MTENKYKVAIYQTVDGKNEVTIHHDKEQIWATQMEIAEIFSSDQSGVSRHISKAIKDGEIEEEGNMQKIHNGFSKPTTVYSLDVIISVGYRVNSKKATHFRKWATDHLKRIATKGYSLDEGTLMATGGLQEVYEKVRAIRTSEANIYTKVKDVFKESSLDYDAHSRAAKSFFAAAQDKFHYAVTEKTAAQLVLERCNAEKEKMGMKTGKQTLQDAKIAKNYLKQEELRLLENISEQFLLFAESKAFRGQKMTMEELSHKLNRLLEANDYPVLYDYKKYYAAAKEGHVKTELGKYRQRLEEAKVDTKKPHKI